ncbi:MAG: DNA polymerase III subunit beta [Eubacteriales bacterium]|nr:DNA polymerase III subunit beta [Eubacteriales bacterium]
MQVICSKSDLTSAISMVQRAIATRSTMAILEGILFTAESDKLTLTGYDLEIGIEAMVKADIREAGQVVVASKIFGDIVRKLPEENVVIRCDNNYRMVIQSGQATFEIFAQAADEYPVIPAVEDAQKLMLPQGLLKNMIEETYFAASTDESRPILNGIKVQAEGNSFEMVAIDGYRLVVRREEHSGKNEIINFIVPSKAMLEVARSVIDADEEIAIFASHNHILFETASFRLVSRLLQGEFLAYERIIPPSCLTKMEVKTQEMLAAIERAALLGNVEQRRFPVSLKTVSENELQISAKTDVGSVEEYVTIEQSGEMIDIDFNPKYLLDALKVIKENKINLEFSGHSAPCLIKPLEGDKFLYLLLPLRR